MNLLALVLAAALFIPESNTTQSQRDTLDNGEVAYYDTGTGEAHLVIGNNTLSPRYVTDPTALHGFKISTLSRRDYVVQGDDLLTRNAIADAWSSSVISATNKPYVTFRFPNGVDVYDVSITGTYEKPDGTDVKQARYSYYYGSNMVRITLSAQGSPAATETCVFRVSNPKITYVEYGNPYDCNDLTTTEFWVYDSLGDYTNLGEWRQWVDETFEKKGGGSAPVPVVTNIAASVATNVVTNVVTKTYVENLGISGGGVSTQYVDSVATAATNYTDAATNAATSFVKSNHLPLDGSKAMTGPLKSGNKGAFIYGYDDGDLEISSGENRDIVFTQDGAFPVGSHLTPDSSPVVTSNMLNGVLTPATNATLVAAKNNTTAVAASTLASAKAHADRMNAPLYDDLTSHTVGQFVWYEDPSVANTGLYVCKKNGAGYVPAPGSVGWERMGDANALFGQNNTRLTSNFLKHTGGVSAYVEWSGENVRVYNGGFFGRTLGLQAGFSGLTAYDGISQYVELPSAFLMIPSGSAYSTAPAPAPATVKYAVGDLVCRSDGIYSCKVAIPAVGEPWTASHWTKWTGVPSLFSATNKYLVATATDIAASASVTNAGAVASAKAYADDTFVKKLTGKTYDFKNGANFNMNLYIVLTNVIQELGGAVVNPPAFN